MGNIKLLKDVRDTIIMNPDSHNQSSWICDTTMCIAGHAAVVSGRAEVRVDKLYGVYLANVSDPEESLYASDVGVEVLDLTDDERHYLFYCFDNETSIRRIDHLLELWEAGKVLDDIPEEDWIEDPTEDAEH